MGEAPKAICFGHAGLNAEALEEVPIAKLERYVYVILTKSALPVIEWKRGKPRNVSSYDSSRILYIGQTGSREESRTSEINRYRGFINLGWFVRYLAEEDGLSGAGELTFYAIRCGECRPSELEGALLRSFKELHHGFVPRGQGPKGPEGKHTDETLKEFLVELEKRKD